MADEAEKKNTPKTLLDLPDECFKGKPPTAKQQAKLAKAAWKYFFEPLVRHEAQTVRLVRAGPSLAEQFAKQFAEQKWLLSKTLKSVTQLKRRRRRRADPVEAEAGVVRQGRPPYDRAPIRAIAEKLKADPSRESQDDFIYRVRVTLKDRGRPVPGDTVLTEICAPYYKDAKSEK